MEELITAEKAMVITDKKYAEITYANNIIKKINEAVKSASNMALYKVVICLFELDDVSHEFLEQQIFKKLKDAGFCYHYTEKVMENGTLKTNSCITLQWTSDDIEKNKQGTQVI